VWCWGCFSGQTGIPQKPIQGACHMVFEYESNDFLGRFRGVFGAISLSTTKHKHIKLKSLDFSQI
jgi:hypothetical protein